MTDAPVRRESLLRLFWAATMPEALAWVGPLLLVFLFQIWILWHRQAPTLYSLADAFRMPALWLGLSLSAVAWLPEGEAGRPEWARRFAKRWGKGQTFTSLGLTPAGPSSGPSWEAPDVIAVVQPILTGLGAASFGFGLGLTVILTFSQERLRDSRADSVAFALLFVCGLAAMIYKVSGSARRLYTWSQKVAASAATAEADADRARINALQAQMNPHFLFNALNTVASLVGTDGARARRTVQSLSGMLKHTLERSAQPLTTVEDELQFVRDYLDIERERFGPRLQVSYSLDPEIVAMAVPTMSLQPLVENAIKHAVTSRLEGGHIRITAAKRLVKPGVRLTVEDDGPGFAPGSEDGTGLGNLRARLRSLYGPEAELVTETLPTGARVSLTIPGTRPE